MLKVKNLNFKYDEVTVFENFNFHGKSREIILLRGENGTGKTTLLKCISGILNGGKYVYVNDKELIHHKSYVTNISYMMSEDTLYEYLTVNENIKLYAELFKEKNAFLDKVNILLHEMELETFNNYLVKHLSKGTRQKIYLIIMLSRNAKIFLLDEPFSALDASTQIKIKNKLIELSESGALIIYTTHINEFSRIATREYELPLRKN